MLRDIRTDLLSATTSGRVPSQWPLAPSVASVTSVANDKGDNEIILGLNTDLLAFALQLRKPPESSAKRPSDKGAVQPVIVSNGVPFFSK